VVAQAYRDDAVIAICRQKGAHGGCWSWPLVQVHRRVGSDRRDSVPEGKKADRVGAKIVEMLGVQAYLGLVAQSVGAIDPDVLCETFAFLVEFHVFRELLTVLSVCDVRSADIFRRILTLEEFDTMVDSPTPAYQSPSVRACSSV
jgi:hypothetical protein